MSEKKVINRNIGIGLGIVSILLIMWLAGAIMNYTNIVRSKDSQIQSLTNQNNQLRSWLTGNLSRINSLNTQISTLQIDKTNLQNQVNILRSDYDKLAKEYSLLSIKYATLESDYATLKRALEKGEVIAKSAI
jgi:chromosome segregation ATPase